MEFDTDTVAAVFSPQVSAGHSFWKKGVDSTVDPSVILHTANGRSLVEPTYNPAWLNENDFKIPLAQQIDSLDYKALYQKAVGKLERIKQIVNDR